MDRAAPRLPTGLSTYCSEYTRGEPVAPLGETPHGPPADREAAVAARSVLVAVVPAGVGSSAGTCSSPRVRTAMALTSPALVVVRSLSPDIAGCSAAMALARLERSRCTLSAAAWGKVSR